MPLGAARAVQKIIKKVGERDDALSRIAPAVQALVQSGDDFGQDDVARPVAAALPYEVRERGADRWFTAAWCARADVAQQIAEALAGVGEPVRLLVWDHSDALTGPANPAGSAGLARRVHVVDGGDGRQTWPWPKLVVWEPGGYRPAGPGPEAATEPLWLPDAFAVYRHALHVRPAGAETWQILAWVLGPLDAELIAAALGIGAADGPYPWRFVSGPREGFPADGVRLESGRYPVRGRASGPGSAATLPSWTTNTPTRTACTVG